VTGSVNDVAERNQFIRFISWERNHRKPRLTENVDRSGGERKNNYSRFDGKLSDLERSWARLTLQGVARDLQRVVAVITGIFFAADDDSFGFQVASFPFSDRQLDTELNSCARSQCQGAAQHRARSTDVATEASHPVVCPRGGVVDGELQVVTEGAVLHRRSRLHE
jgi:hypothetical protein